MSIQDLYQWGNNVLSHAFNLWVVLMLATFIWWSTAKSIEMWLKLYIPEKKRRKKNKK